MPNEDIIKEMERFVIFDRQDKKYFKLRDYIKNERGEYFKHDACNLWLQDGVAIDVFVPFKADNKIVEELKIDIGELRELNSYSLKNISNLKEQLQAKDKEIKELKKDIKNWEGAYKKYNKVIREMQGEKCLEKKI